MAAEAAVKVAAHLGVRCTDPVILADGANVIVYLSPAPVVPRSPRAPPPSVPNPHPAQPLHGDAGAGNLMATGRGWVWHDFEDTCSGPVAWDLAASTASQRLDGRRILAAYGEPVDAAKLAVCQQLRRLHLTVWYALYAERLPDLRSRAAQLLALWPAP